ncbi:MAG TPA: hypothetical protein VIC02_05495, partial [Kineobactrum sp.]
LLLRNAWISPLLAVRAGGFGIIVRAYRLVLTVQLAYAFKFSKIMAAFSEFVDGFLQGLPTNGVLLLVGNELPQLAAAELARVEVIVVCCHGLKLLLIPVMRHPCGDFVRYRGFGAHSLEDFCDHFVMAWSS